MSTTIPFPVRYDQQQAEELAEARMVASMACPEDFSDLPFGQQHRWIARAAAFLRSMHAIWRTAAMNRATDAVDAVITEGSVGALFTGMKLEKRRAIARSLAVAAVYSYNGVLTGDNPLPPGEYLAVTDHVRRTSNAD